jgi:hypothetical protein
MSAFSFALVNIAAIAFFAGRELEHNRVAFTALAAVLLMPVCSPWCSNTAPLTPRQLVLDMTSDYILPAYFDLNKGEGFIEEIVRPFLRLPAPLVPQFAILLAILVYTNTTSTPRPRTTKLIRHKSVPATQKAVDSSSTVAHANEILQVEPTLSTPVPRPATSTARGASAAFQQYQTRHSC